MKLFGSARKGRNLGGGILVVAAHPDDEVLGAGGTVARHVGAGGEAAVLILGEGVTSRSAERNLAPQAAVATLQGQAIEANTVLGVKVVRFGGLPDNRFDELNLLELVKTVENVIEELVPSVVYTHHPGDLNVDHRLTFQAVLTATRPVPGGTVRELSVFEVPSSTEWSFGRIGSAFCPNLFVDISETLERKLRALERYTGEIRPAPHPRSVEVVRANAVRRGAAVGRPAAEAFELVRGVQ